MKLVLAIINRDDANAVTQALTKRGFSSTKLATTGGFLMAGNVTVLIGVDEEKVQTVIDIIKEPFNINIYYILHMTFIDSIHTVSYGVICRP